MSEWQVLVENGDGPSQARIPRHLWPEGAPEGAPEAAFRGPVRMEIDVHAFGGFHVNVEKQDLKYGKHRWKWKVREE